MKKSVRRWKSLTAVVQLPHTACHLLKCHVRAPERGLILVASTMGTIHLRRLTTRLRFHPWQLRDRCLACRKHQNRSDRNITSRLLDTWTSMRTTMMRAMT